MVEAKAYEADLSDEERREILSRVSEDAPGVFLYRELPVQSPFSIALLHEQLTLLAEGHPQFAYVLDLRGVHRPDAASRAMLRECVSRIARRVRHVAIAIDGNLFIAAMAKLLAFGMGYRSVSMHASIEEALAEAKRVLAG